MEKLNSHFLKLCLFIFVSFFVSSVSFGQRTVSGTITDAETGDPLIGANVIITGTSTGTITDLDGNYSLSVPDDAVTLSISYTGFTEQIAPITGDVVNVALSAGQILDEVVVVGYGAVKKSDATGAVVGVTEEDFNKGVVVSPEQLIQGRAAGVQITTASGEPGAGASIRIRGAGSIRNGNNPLFVVDGVPLNGSSSTGGGNDAGLGSSSARNPLNFLNPQDIASIDILKDASATAIYGSRGANGVVLITTKKGSGQKNKIDYSFNLGFSNITKKYDLLNADEFLDAYAQFNGQAAAASLDGGADTDWQAEILRTAITQGHNIAFSGSTDAGNYRLSFGVHDQEGIIKESGFQRYTGRFNAEQRFLNDRLTIASQITLAQTKDDNVPITDNSGFRGDLMGNALKLNPTLPVRDSNGELVQPSQTEYNPVAILELSEDYTNTLRGLGNVSAEYKLTNNLSFKSLIGFDRSFSSRNSAFSRDLNAAGIINKGRLYMNDIQINDRLWENYFSYNNTFGAANLSAVLGYSYQQFNYYTKGFEMTNFNTADPLLMINNIASANISGGNAIVPTNSSNTTDELQSYFTRVNLGIADKYIFTGTLRTDGSTRFGDNNRYGLFPSLAFKWRLIDEAFIPDLFSDLGLRIGYGVTGNQEIPYNLFQPRSRYSGWDINEGGDVNGGGLNAVSFANDDLKWETTTQINLGLDFGFMNNRLSGSVDVYRKNTNDLLLQIVSAQPSPQPFRWENLDADIINNGVELALNYVAVDISKFSWDINFNIARNINTIQNYKGINDTGGINGQGLTGAFAQRIQEGQPLYAFFLREFGGFDAEGISIYPNGDKQEFVGAQPIPTLSLGLTNSFSFGNVDFNFFFNGQFGHHIYSNTANAFFTAGSLANGRNVTKDVVGNGESNLNAPDVSTRFLERGDFLRLQNANLGYTFETGSLPFSNLRVFLTGQNLFLWTQYSGQDPEVDTNKSLNGIPSVGIDYTAYPRARTFTLGVNVGF